MQFRRLLFFGALVLTFSGCYQIHSDDELRTTPTTNNPHLIQDSHKSGLPGVGY